MYLNERNPIFFAENNCKVYSYLTNEYVPFIMYDSQKKLINSLLSYKFCVAYKARQVGASTAAAFYAAWKCLFSDPNNPEKILIITNKEKSAQMLLAKIKEFIKNCSNSFNIQFDTPNNIKELQLSNRSAIKITSSIETLKGYTPTLIIIDEASEIRKWKEIWHNLQPLLTHNSSCLILSGELDKLDLKNHPFTLVSLYQE